MNYIAWVCRGLIFAVSVYVLISLVPVIRAQWTGGNGCPTIGPVPACYVVALCYAAMGLAALINPFRFNLLFWLGWSPVFLLALSGSVLEVSGTPTCPIAPGGTPMCFYSLALATLLAPVFYVARRFSVPGKPHDLGVEHSG